MSTSHYWPTEPGIYELERYRLGGPTYAYRFDGCVWIYSDDTEAPQDTDDLIRDYFLGVRRETSDETHR